MARLSKDEHDNLLQQIADTTNASPEIMDLVQKLRDDFDESLQVDTEEITREWSEKYENLKSELDRTIGERDEARRQYRDRFFNVQQEAEVIVERQKKDSPKSIADVLNIEEVI